MLLDEKTVLEIWLNPGLNFTMFRETGPRSENGCKKIWHFFIWNRVKIWRTGRHTPTNNSQDPWGSQLPCSFYWYYKLRVPIHHGLEKLPVNVTKSPFRVNKYVCQALYQTLQTTKMNFESLWIKAKIVTVYCQCYHPIETYLPPYLPLTLTRCLENGVQSYKEVLELVNVQYVCSVTISNLPQLAIIDTTTNSNCNHFYLFALEEINEHKKFH